MALAILSLLHIAGVCCLVFGAFFSDAKAFGMGVLIYLIVMLALTSVP
jgi:hypothetical protein